MVERFFSKEVVDADKGVADESILLTLFISIQDNDPGVEAPSRAGRIIHNLSV